MGSELGYGRVRTIEAVIPIPDRAALLRRRVAGVPSGAGLLALVLLAALGWRAGSTPTDPNADFDAPRALNATVTVGRDRNDFVDAESGSNTTTIKAGQSVTWAWTGGSHSITSGACCTASGTWDSGVMSPGSFTRTFPTPGTYRYFCSVHGPMMTGTVVVLPSGD